MINRVALFRLALASRIRLIAHLQIRGWNNDDARIRKFAIFIHYELAACQIQDERNSQVIKDGVIMNVICGVVADPLVRPGVIVGLANSIVCDKLIEGEYLAYYGRKNA